MPGEDLTKADYLHFGGQAIIEGVMMRSPNTFAVACRAPNGEVVLQAEPLEKTWIGRQKWLMLPFLRGTWAILDAMTLGVRAMRFAATVQTDEKYAAAIKPDEDLHVAEPAATGPIPFVATTPISKEEERAIVGDDTGSKDGEKKVKKSIQDIAIGGTIFISLGFGLFLFHYVPNIVANAIGGGRKLGDAQTSLITEFVKIGLFLGYLWLISRMKEIQRVFQYHGAEHKAINALELKEPLDVKHTRPVTRFHPRCGTSFAAIVFIIGLIVFPFVPRPHTGSGFLDVTLRFLTEIAVLPFIAGTAYEGIRMAGKFRNSGIVNAVFAPGIWTQRLTTAEPHDDQIEVALAALQACIDAEEERRASGAAPTKDVAAVVS